MKRQMKKTERGFTVVEVLIVLVVGLLIVMNAGKLSDWLFGTAKLASTEQSLAAFRVNIQHAYTDVRSYDSISNDELISAMVVPPTMLNGDGTAYDGNYWRYAADGVTPVIWKKQTAA